jgi:hypothetical protein
MDSLPPELRLNIYEYLVLADGPLQGETARTTRTGLDLAILRTNRRIYEEAKALFLGRNTFFITSASDVMNPANSKGGKDDAFCHYEPSFSTNELTSLRHLTLDLVCRSAEGVEETELVEIWQPAERAVDYSAFSFFIIVMILVT